MMSTTKIAHISDLHLTAEDDASRSEPKIWGRLQGMNDNFRRLLGSIREKEPDAVLVTGDVTDCGHQRAWEVFWEEIGKAGLSDRTIVVPGNHDIAVLGVRMQPKSEDLARVRSGLALGKQETEFPWVRTLSDQIAVFGVDSTNSGNLTGLTNALGTLGPHQLLKLGKLMRAHDKLPVKLILIHHSPNIPGILTALRRGLQPTLVGRSLIELKEIDRFALRMLAGSFGVKAILHGHTHDFQDRRVNGVRIIGCPAGTEPTKKKKELQYCFFEIAQKKPWRMKAVRVGV